MPFVRVKAIIVCYHDDLHCSLVLHRKDAQAGLCYCVCFQQKGTHINSELFFLLGHLGGSFCGFSLPGTRLWFAYCSNVCNDNRYLQNTKVRFLLYKISVCWSSVWFLFVLRNANKQ